MTAVAPCWGQVRHPNTPPLCLITAWATPELAGVTVVGELDLATAPLLAAKVASTCNVTSGEPRGFLLDLAAVTFLDSAGLRAADRAVLAATNWGWQVRVVQPTASEPRQMILLALRKGRSLQ
jgi:anti-anti-sigma factor